MTSKQRSNLKSIAAKMKPIGQVGKGGVTDNLLKGLSDALEARELIKITVSENAEADADTVAENLAELLDAEVVAVIGRKAILYRYSSRDHFAHLEF